MRKVSHTAYSHADARDSRFWDAARHRLSTLLACADAESIYAPSLLVVLCPGTLTSEEEASLRSEVRPPVESGQD